MRYKAIVTAVLLTATFSAIADDEPLFVKVPRLTFESALKVAQAAMAECRKQGYQVTATVVDRSGYTQAMVRDTLAPPISIGISRDKAFTAVNFGSDSMSLVKSMKDSPLFNRDGLVLSGGGVIIDGGGQTYGAVGVSGAPGDHIDEACAKAGVEAIKEDLEMGDF